MAVLARLLAPKDFGLVAMATTLTSFVGIFTDLGLSAATVQRKEIDQATVSALFYINLAMGLAMAIVCAAAAPIVGWAFGDPRVVTVTMALGLSIPVSAAGSQHYALLQRGMRWAPLQWTPVIAQATGAIVAILLALQTAIGYWALVAQLWVAAIVSTGLLWRFSHWRPSLRPRWRDAGTALPFGLSLVGSYFANYFHRQFDNVLVGWRWGATDLGYYTRAYQLLLLPYTLIEGPLAFAIVPALSRLQDEPQRWRSAFLRAFVVVNLLSSGLSAMLIASAEPLVRVVYGAGWGDAEPVFLLLSISMFAATPFSALSWVYVSLGHGRRMLLWAVLVTPFFVLSFLLGLPYGPRGVALCFSVAMCLAVTPGLAFMTRCAPVSLRDCLAAWLPAAVAGGSAAWGARLLATTWPNGGSLFDVAERSLIAIALYAAGAGALAALRLLPLADILTDPVLRGILRGALAGGARGRSLPE
jgi:PST family polysaccharide transporter